MGRTACIEPQCLYKGALYLYLEQDVKVPGSPEIEVNTYKNTRLHNLED